MESLKNTFYEISGLLYSILVGAIILTAAFFVNLYVYRKWLIVIAIVYFGFKSYFYGR